MVLLLCISLLAVAYVRNTVYPSCYLRLANLQPSTSLASLAYRVSDLFSPIVQASWTIITKDN